MSDDLIATLSADVRPMPRHGLQSRLILGLVAGGVLAGLLMAYWLGLRPDLSRAVMTPIFWAKFGFTMALTIAGFVAAERLARPGGRLRLPLAVVFAVIALAGAAGIIQVLANPPERVRYLVLGGTALVCPFYIVALSTPVLAVSLAVMRRLAPTNLPAAGFAAGLLSGAAGAWIYAFHCTESGLPFIALWYTAGVLATALIGAALGRWLLRW
jgi:hypothetical protein